MTQAKVVKKKKEEMVEDNNIEEININIDFL